MLRWSGAEVRGTDEQREGVVSWAGANRQPPNISAVCVAGSRSESLEDELGGSDPRAQGLSERERTPLRRGLIHFLTYAGSRIPSIE